MRLVMRLEVVAEMIMKIARVEHKSASADSPRMRREHKAQGSVINGTNDQIIWAAGAGAGEHDHSLYRNTLSPHDD